MDEQSNIILSSKNRPNRAWNILWKKKEEISSKSRSELSEIKDILQELNQTRGSTPGVGSEIFNLKGRLTKFGKDSRERDSGLKFKTLQATDEEGTLSVFYFVI